jgi:hypothetical protein
MQNQFLFPGIGQAVRQVTSSTNSSVTEDTAIGTGGYTEWIAAHDCKELCFAFEFAAEATGTMVVQRAKSANPSSSFDDHETITITAEWWRSWAAGETLLGFYRVYNNSGQSAVIYMNKRIA